MQESQQSEFLYELVEPDGIKIQVKISNPTQIKQTISSYTVYKIKGVDKLGDFQVNRRYSDFDHVRNIMLQKWPGCFIPPLPRKKLVGNINEQWIQERMQGLSKFIDEISRLKHLWYGAEFQILLRDPVQANIQIVSVDKRLKELPYQSCQGIIHKYNENLSKVNKMQPDPSFVTKIAEFERYVRKTCQIIKNLKQCAFTYIQANKSNMEHYTFLFNYVFPQYQKHFLSSYANFDTEGKLIFAETKDGKLSRLINVMKKIGEDRNIQQIYKILEKQERQLQAFQELFKIRDYYDGRVRHFHEKQTDLALAQSKLNAGKQNLLKAIIKSNIEEDKEKVRTSIEQNSEKSKKYSYLLELINIIVVNFEIPRFKKEKVHEFYDTIRKMTEIQIKTSLIKEQICDHVLKNHNMLQLSNGILKT